MESKRLPLKSKAGLTRVVITGIHGTNRKIDARIQDDTLILVGENGSGKTTFLRMLYDLFSGRWFSLARVKFDTLTITLNKEKIPIRYADLRKNIENLDKRLLQDLPPSVRRPLQALLESGEATRNPEVLERFASRYGIPYQFFARQLTLFEQETEDSEGFEVASTLKSIRTRLNAQVLYLPTYRRIERELASILEGVDVDELRRRPINRSNPEDAKSYLELVEFGMADVAKAIKDTTGRLRDFQLKGLTELTLKYFDDIVSEAYKTADTQALIDASDQAIRSVLERMDENIVPKSRRGEWENAIIRARRSKELTQHDLIIRHYFLKLLNFQEDLQENERNMQRFCSLCNEYIFNKTFFYDSTSFSFRIVPSPELGGDRVELSDLSSGEKQIVSLFSHLYLSGAERFFVLIDEPELSLSVPWQRRFLPDVRNGHFCAGLIAVTHSPFIYSNELEPYAHSIGEFVHG
jgi:ABC-type cobalamin/Fe3+-siderophores transport system ATPase subunit